MPPLMLRYNLTTPNSRLIGDSSLQVVVFTHLLRHKKKERYVTVDGDSLSSGVSQRQRIPLSADIMESNR